MSNKQPPRVQLNFQPDYLPESEGAEQPSIDFDIKDLDVQEELDELDVPSIVEKEKINERDIFDNIPDTEVADEETGEVNPNFIYEKPTVKPVKVKKPRKPMSEEHKKKLALAREKAMAVRKAKAEERKKMKELENQEKELLKAQKVKKVQKLKKEVEDSESKVEEVVEKPQRVSGITKKDLEDAQFEAIAKYETLRKQRKAEKKQAQAIEESKKELLRKITPQQQYKYRDGSNRWDMCY